MRFRKLQEEETDISIAPLIDVVFLLLIFFMVTSHFDVASGIHIRLPKSAKKMHSEVSDKINLIIDKSGEIYLKGNKIDIKALKKELHNLSDEKGTFNLILYADEDVRHGKVVQIMDIAKTAGVDSIIIAARWKPGKEL